MDGSILHYYDPMYDYQLEKSDIPIIFSGDREAVTAYLSDPCIKIEARISTKIYFLSLIVKNIPSLQIDIFLLCFKIEGAYNDE